MKNKVLEVRLRMKCQILYLCGLSANPAWPLAIPANDHKEDGHTDTSCLKKEKKKKDNFSRI